MDAAALEREIAAISHDIRNQAAALKLSVGFERNIHPRAAIVTDGAAVVARLADIAARADELAAKLRAP